LLAISYVKIKIYNVQVLALFKTIIYSLAQDLFPNTNQMAVSEVITSDDDKHRFDIDPDQTFHFDADPDPDPDPDSTPNFTYAGRSEKLLGFHSQQSQRTLFKLSRQRHRGQSSNILDRKKHGLALHLAEKIRIRIGKPWIHNNGHDSSC
jgi:hypothetical protein